MAAAHRRTGLHSFEETRFLEHLGVVAKSADSDARLSLLGRVGLRGALVNALSTRLLLEQARRERPDSFARQLVPPLIVLGLPRSGTTYLHRLLGLDPASRTLPFWKLRRPLTQPGQPDRRLEIARREARDFRLLAPGIDAKHLSDAESPEECLFLFDCTLLSATFWVAGPLYSYLEHYRQQDHSGAYRVYEELLRFLQAETPTARLALKAPGHTPHVAELRQVLPQAKLVQLHRDPVRAVTSVCSLFYTLHRVVTDELDLRRMARANVDLMAWGIERCLRYREREPEHGIVDVMYADLVRDPIGTVRSIYVAHELPFSAEFETALERYVRDNPQHKHGVHHYDPRDYALHSDELRERFLAYLSAFPRAAEEP